MQISRGSGTVGAEDVNGRADVERADPGAAEPGQIPTDVECGTEIPCQGTNVGAGGAVHLDVQIDARAVLANDTPWCSEDVEPRHGHRPRGELDRLSGAHPFVGAPA